jgi:hypothetical protein
VVYPSIGPLRFGPPYLVVAAAVAAARWPQHARAMRGGTPFLLPSEGTLDCVACSV